MSKNIRPTGEETYRDGTGSYQAKQRRIESYGDFAGEETLTVDVCVIGSGAGGGPAAKELAEGGLSVAILEEGKWWSTDEYTLNVADMTRKMYRDAGLSITLGNTPIILPVGSAVGGTTVINGGTCFRAPRNVLELWAEKFGLDGFNPDELDPYFRRVERIGNVSQVPAELAGKKSAIIRRGAEALGYSGDYLYRNSRGCVGSGTCHWGCPTGAKQHVGITYAPLAWNAGAITYTGVRAERIEHSGGRASTVIARTPAGGRLRVACEHVIVACGSFHTPQLLQESGIGGKSGQLGRNLTVHPTPTIRAVFDEQTDPFVGVPQAYHIDEFASEGLLFEESPLPLPVAALSTLSSGRSHRETMLEYRNCAQIALVIPDTSRGSIRYFRGYPVIHYNVNRYDISQIKRGLEIIADIFWAAGARELHLPISSVPMLTDGDSTPLKQHNLKPSQIGLAAWHPLGTAHAGAESESSVVGDDLRVHGFENVYVSDGSVLPSSMAVNPQITIMALATRMAYGILGKSAPTDEPFPEHMPDPAINVKLPDEV